ncbi:hypothetical protein Clacol_007139 [Clathrus columnatus]|uniref:Epoxide hydrolase N-terminal domain-containing protein n=1 Tax=Clathrus columnatus TaxID=1419009 RepID=A0AAV5AIF2_9AGAM|nr:hypothetical protein Clacol_007139 [Clathrus columnatus]
MTSTNATPRPFHIDVSDSQISFLKEKLNLIRFPDELEDAKWDYGVPLNDMKCLVDYWKTEFDWKKQEKLINETLPQHTIDIPVDGFGTLNVHFVHQKSREEQAIPLLFVHGWPGSVLEVSKILPKLTSPATGSAPAFHVVAPSLPGYGFSEGSKKKGFGLSQYAEVCHKVMIALGYEQYVSQGGDWGLFITRRICQLYGDKHCKASLTNMALGTPPTLFQNPLAFLKLIISSFTPFEQAGLARTMWFRSRGFGYASEQSTQPQTLGYSLADSPSGLLAWIYEKLVNWTDEYPWTNDEGLCVLNFFEKVTDGKLNIYVLVLTWISIYWFSKDGPAASLRIYYEVMGVTEDIMHPKQLTPPPSVLLGQSVFPKDLVVLPRQWSAAYGNTVFYKEHLSGGHFAAYERPVELVEDLQTMFGRGGPAFQVIKGSNGYSAVNE